MMSLFACPPCSSCDVAVIQVHIVMFWVRDAQLWGVTCLRRWDFASSHEKCRRRGPATPGRLWNLPLPLLVSYACVCVRACVHTHEKVVLSLSCLNSLGSKSKSHAQCAYCGLFSSFCHFLRSHLQLWQRSGMCVVCGASPHSPVCGRVPW